MKNRSSKNLAREAGAFHTTTSKVALVSSILGFGFIGVNPAEAVIINHADVNGLRTFQDAGTGEVWVDLDNFSNQTTTQMKAIVEAAGFTFANKFSVQALLDGLPLTNPPTAWNSYASIMGKSSTRDLIWGSYDNGNVNNSVGWAYSFSMDPAWSLVDNVVSRDTSFSDMGIFAYQSSSTSVPEPFTIIGTLVGGTAAFRMRKKLKSINK